MAFELMAPLMFAMLAAFYWVIDVRGHRPWAYPLVVVGMNSIAMYCLAALCRPWIAMTLKTHLGPRLFAVTYGPIIESLLVVFVMWLKIPLTAAGWLGF